MTSVSGHFLLPKQKLSQNIINSANSTGVMHYKFTESLLCFSSLEEVTIVGYTFRAVEIPLTVCL